MLLRDHRSGTRPVRSRDVALGPGVRFVASALLLLVPGLPASAATWLVRPDGTGDVPTIQAALDAAASGDEIVLASGTYRGAGNFNLNPLGKAVWLHSESGVPAECVIDCDYEGRGFDFDHGETRNTIIEGITITIAQVNDWFGGAAACCWMASPTLRNCRFDVCYSLIGGALALWNGAAPLLQGCSFQWTGGVIGVGAAGGAIYAQSSLVEIEDCVFQHGSSVSGGAIWSDGSTIRATRTVFERNIGAGAALWCQGHTTVILQSCTLSMNFSFDGDEGDAQVYLKSSSTLTADHCLFGGRTQTYGAQRAIHCDVHSSAALACCDVWGHPGGDWVGCLAGQQDEDGNLWMDALFCDWEYADFRLRDDSPCAAGNNPTCGQIGRYGVACYAPGPTGACCMEDGSCQIVSSDQCEGIYLGDEANCVPNPCAPTAVESVTWGRLKVRFR